MKPKSKQFLVFNYTDGIPAAREPFNTREEAEAFIREFPDNFRKRSGRETYKTSRLEHISPEDVDMQVVEDWAELVGDES